MSTGGAPRTEGAGVVRAVAAGVSARRPEVNPCARGPVGTKCTSSSVVAVDVLQTMNREPAASTTLRIPLSRGLLMVRPA
jgi:hypothetical protein